MPTWDKILNEVEQLNPLVVLSRYIEKLSGETGRTTVCYMTAFSVIKPPVPQPFHAIVDQDMQGFMTCAHNVDKDNVDIVLHTPGGDYEAAKRIINYLQSIFGHIRVIVPHIALSGGTLMACASDEIFMGPYSSLGPTDPQVLLGKNYVPINAIIDEFRQAYDEVSKDPRKALLWHERLKQVPFGRLRAIETMRENAIQYLADLLVKRNCAGKDAATIQNAARYLNSDAMHTSHGRGICLDEARSAGLNVHDLSKEKVLEDIVLSVYHAATILFERTSVQKVIINNKDGRYILHHG